MTSPRQLTLILDNKIAYTPTPYNYQPCTNSQRSTATAHEMVFHQQVHNLKETLVADDYGQYTVAFRCKVGVRMCGQWL